jgi:hypothetical protein
MNTPFKYHNLFIFALLSIAPLARGQKDCELKKEKDDLKVYTCPSPDSKIKILKVELLVENTSFQELLDFVNDIDNYVNWQYNTIEARVLETQARSKIYRTVVSAPWPMSNREMIMEISHEFDSLRQELLIESRHNTYEYPEDEDLIRVPFCIAKWRVVSQKAGLRIEYTIRIDPGGSVPAWLVNVAMADGPYYSFINLKKALKR